MAAGRRRAEKVERARGRVLLPLIGALVAVAAWVFLVRAAIDFGRAARVDGAPSQWLLSVGAAVGAVLCLLLALVLVARIRETVTPRSRYPGSHRQ